MNAAHTKKLYDNLNKLINKQRLNNKKVVIFGVNAPAYKTIIFLQSKKVKIYAIIDNYKGGRGDRLFGLEIKKPEDVLGKFDNDVIVLIASQYFDEMSAQLQTLGYKSNEHIIQTLKYSHGSVSCYRFAQATVEFIKGYNIYNRLMKHYGKDCVILVFPYSGIGDIYFIGAYLPQYLKKHNIRKYVITLIGKTCKKTLDLFDFDNVELLTQEQSDDLMCYGRMIGFENTSIKCLTHNLVHTDILMGVEFAKKAPWGEIVKKYVLGLDDDIKERLPQTIYRQDYIEEFFSKNSLKKGKTVILSPYANTITGLDMKIWGELVNELNQSGFCVCTNSSDKEKEPVLDNTTGVFFPIADANAIIESAGYFVGLRSGLCDVISGANAKKVILYPYKESLFFTISGIDFGKNNKEILCECDNGKIVQQILECFGYDSGNSHSKGGCHDRRSATCK